MLHSASLSDPPPMGYPPFATPPYPGSLPNGFTDTSPNQPQQPQLSNGHVRPSNGFSTATPAAIAALTAAAAASIGIPPNVKDSRWLTLEVCRQFQRNQCTRDENECKFAHPPNHVDVQNGRVICCYDSIKGKCQRRDPPCKYLHPPQHLREQLMMNGRNNMIIRNMQLQLFQHQLLAQSGLFPLNAAALAAAAAAAAANPPGSGAVPSSVAPTAAPNPILYPAPGPLALGQPTVSNGYQFLNMGFAPYLSTITGGPQLPGLEVLPPDPITSPSKRTGMGEGKNSMSLYLPRTNGGVQSSGANKIETQETSGGCVMVVNGNPLDSITGKEMDASPPSCAAPIAMRSIAQSTAGSSLAAATAATLYALQNSQNATLLNMQPGQPQTHTIAAASLHPASLAAVVNGTTVPGGTVAAASYTTVPDPAGYFQPAYHIEIPPYHYQ
ncbi:unnamed protein product [Calicophoron daubneyi]|uniref:C3H1-type domain-containing protein n=1 Tax=Calicophoron daubneyi TaxID=300641 RepID=A0AAV2TVA8_CALDB